MKKSKKHDDHSGYFESDSQKKQVGRKVLHSSRTVFLMHALVLVSSFAIGLGLVSQMDNTRAATNYRISPSGNDANPCTSTQPCLTMNRAYQVASPGDTVEMAGGTYGNQTITGTKSSWVYFRPVTGASVTVGSLHTNADFVEVRDVTVGQWQITASNINDVTLRNVAVKGYLGYSGNGTARISMYGGSVGPGVDYHPQIAPSAGNGAGWATDLLFDGVYWHDWTRTNVGVHTECLQVAGTTRFTMRNNKFERCAIFDLSFTAYNGSGNPTDVLLENNYFATTTGNGSINDGYYALNYGNMQGITIRNNSFGQGINENTGNSNVRLIGNILATAWNCLNATYSYNVYQWTSNLNCSPTDKWVNGPQYSTSNLGYVGPTTSADGLRLASTSPAKDFIPSAQATTLGLPTSDIDGHARPVNGNYDAGADEYGSTGGVVTPPPPPPAAPSAPVVTISASPTSLQSGASSNLTWSSTNSPSSCTASGDWSGTKASAGTQNTGSLTTVKTYTYTLACSNAGGTGSATATVAVSAAPPVTPPAPVISMSVSPSTINQGSSSTIAWSATNSPTSCTASGDWSGTKAASGTQGTGALDTVKTYTYSLSCTNAGGTTNGSVALVVLPVKPVVSISASPSTVKVGATSSLNWNATNSPSSCTASGDWSGTKAASGSESTPAMSTKRTYTYTLTCSNAGGSGSASVAVTANATGTSKGAKPRVKLTVSPETVEAGQVATLAWVAEDGANFSCKAGDGWTGDKDVTGTENVKPSEDGQTYTITCDNENGGESASVAVSVADIKDDGTVTVNKTTVPNLKVENPSIVGESKAGEPTPLSQASNNPQAAAVTQTGLLSTTSGKLTLAGIFAAVVTTVVGGVFVAHHYYNWNLPFLKFFRRGKGGGNGPIDMISG